MRKKVVAEIADKYKPYEEDNNEDNDAQRAVIADFLIRHSCAFLRPVIQHKFNF